MEQFQFEHDEPIFLTLHYTETKKKIAQFITEYNDKLEKEWMESPEKFLENHGGRTFNQMRFKSCHEASTLAVLDMYGTYLKRNRSLRLINAKGFRLNNASLGTKLNKRCSKVTAWRHISKALEIGIFQNKVFHGSNSSFEISFNPQLLVAEYNEQYCSLVVDYWCLIFKTERMPVNIHKRIGTLVPQFQDFPEGYMLSSCNDTVSRTLLDHNNNMAEGIGTSSDYFLVYEPDQGVGYSDGKTSQEGFPCEILNDHQSEGLAPPNVPNDDLTHSERSSLNNYVKFAWGFASSTIYRERYVSENELKQIYGFLSLYFAPSVKKNNGLAIRYHNFGERMMLAMKWQGRNPEYRFMNPVTYFDPSTEKGFRATKNWLRKTAQKRVKSHEYNSNNKLLADLCRRYSLNPNPDNYRTATQTLSKKKSPILLEIFNEFVVNGEKVNPELFKRSYLAMENENDCV